MVEGLLRSKSTWEPYELVKQCQALDEFEQITRIQAVSSEQTNRSNKIYRQWSKNKVQQWLQTLNIPESLDINNTQLVQSFKRHSIDGVSLTELTQQNLTDMRFAVPVAAWIIGVYNSLSRRGDCNGYTLRSYSYRSVQTLSAGRPPAVTHGHLYTRPSASHTNRYIAALTHGAHAARERTLV